MHNGIRHLSGGEKSRLQMVRLMLTDANFLDLLRVVQLALVRGNIAPADEPALTQQILREYPTRDAMLNRAKRPISGACVRSNGSAFSPR